MDAIKKKSLTLRFPSYDQVPKPLIHHFMRGYFDGDGCIYISSRNCAFSVVGTNEFLDIYEKILLKGIGKKTPTKRIHADHWNENTECISYGGKLQALKIFNFLYRDSTIYLERKFNKWKEILPS